MAKHTKKRTKRNTAQGVLRHIKRALIILLLAGIVFYIGMMTVIFYTGAQTRPLAQSDVIIVLGARVMPDGTLSTTLEHRIEKAYEVYSAGYADAFILCGAQGGDEPMTEAAAMAGYLKARGVREDAIFRDETSTDTIENLRNAMAIMESEGYHDAIVVTSEYHLQRALWLARDAGLDAYGAAAPGPDYWHNRIKARAREVLSWINYFTGGSIKAMLGGG